MAEAIINSNDGGIFNTYKENRYVNLLNDYIKKSGVSGLFLDEKISLEEKRIALTDLVEGVLKGQKIYRTNARNTYRRKILCSRQQ